MGFERCDSALERRRDVDGVGRPWRPGEGDPPHPGPWREAVLLQVGEHPPVRGVAHGVDDRQTGDPVVGHVPPAAGVRLAVIRRDHQLGPVPADHSCNVTAQRQPVLQRAVAVVEQLERRDADGVTRGALLVST